jgi:hypothetical protein
MHRQKSRAALGASYGGYMANWILGHTNRFKCIVSHDGIFDTESAYGTTEELWFPEWEFKGPPWKTARLYQKFSPRLFADKFKTPTLVVHGQNDYRLDVSEGFQLFTTLQRLGFRRRCCISRMKAIGCLSRRTRGFGTKRSTTGLINGANVDARETRALQRCCAKHLGV